MSTVNQIPEHAGCDPIVLPRPIGAKWCAECYAKAKILHHRQSTITLAESSRLLSMINDSRKLK